MKHTLKTVGVALALIAFVIALFAIASVLNDWLAWLMKVEVLCWVFFGVGIVFTIIASSIVSAIGNWKKKKSTRKKVTAPLVKKDTEATSREKKSN